MPLLKPSTLPHRAAASKETLHWVWRPGAAGGGRCRRTGWARRPASLRSPPSHTPSAACLSRLAPPRRAARDAQGGLEEVGGAHPARRCRIEGAALDPSAPGGGGHTRAAGGVRAQGRAQQQGGQRRPGRRPGHVARRLSLLLMPGAGGRDHARAEPTPVVSDSHQSRGTVGQGAWPDSCRHWLTVFFLYRYVIIIIINIRYQY